jgi:hypothetical protein
MIEFYKTNDARMDVQFINDDGSVMNISGCTIFFTVKSQTSDPDDLALISQDVVSHDVPESGLSHIDVTNAETNICPGDYFCDLKLKDIAGRCTTFYVDTFRVLEVVTHRVA